MRNKTKKILISIVLGVYILTTFFQSTIYRGNTVFAAGTSEDKIDYTNIVAIIVNDEIYNGIKNDVERYAKTYIQGAGNNKYTSISNSKAFVFPINVDNFSAKNIAQLLENMYFDGISGQPSKLVGVILIGDIPLPVVNQGGYIFPTIYPYVDFEEQKFIWDDDSKYFVYNNNPNGQAEIWHGMINFENNINEYKAYFDKLKSYLNNPNKYIGKALWYEDFIGDNKYFNDNSLNFYLNNFIFAEDLGYHRYSDLMIKVMQGQRNKEMEELIESLNEINSGANYTGQEALSALTDNMNTPTMEIKSMLDNGYLASYSSLFGQKYLKTIVNNVKTANRWIESRTGSDGKAYYLDAFDTVYKKAEINDEVTLRSNGGAEPFIIMLNNALEEAVDKKVEQEKYRLDEVVPLTYLKYEGRKRFLGKCVWQIYDAYENYFFGTNAKYADTMEDASTYRGTFRNYSAIDGLTIQNIQNSQNPSTDLSGLDLNKKSIGGSYDIFATQVDANRGYNYNNSLKEYEIYSGNKTAVMENWDVTCVKKFLGICTKRRRNIVSTNGSGCDLTSEDGDQGGCENPLQYAMRIWGGASTLNLTGNGGGDFVWNSEYSYTGATSPVFDIEGSHALDINKPEYASNSFESIQKYSSLILRRFSPDTDDWPKYKSGNPTKKAADSYGFGYDYSMDYEVKFTNWIPIFDGRHISGWTGKSVLKENDVDYFEKYYDGAKKEGNIIKIAKQLPGGDASCQGAGEIYTYKTLDSRIKNDSVNADELNGYSYKIFKDNVSHVKQFYDELVGYIEAISGSVSAAVGSETGALNNKLQFIKTEINDINSGFKSIMNFDLDDLNGMDTGAILLKARDWVNVFNDSKADNLLSMIKGAQDDVLNLKGLVELGDTLFDGVVDFIDEEKKLFQVNGWNLIFLVTRKYNINQSIREILDNYKKIKTTVSEAGIIYGTINELGKEDFAGQQIPDFGFSLLEDLLSLNVVENLSGKKERLGNLLNGSGCETKYRKLCESLDVIMNNYNEYVDTINEEKQGINKLKIQKFDDDGNILTGEFEIVNDIFKDLFFNAVFTHIDNGEILDSVYEGIRTIPQTMNEELTGTIHGMSMTTSDRPIDSPRYLTFKGIGGDKVTFIYPDLYKAEIFSGISENGLLTLKTPAEIKVAIQKFLVDTVKKYNEYLYNEISNHNRYYQQNANAFDKLDELSQLANPKHFHDDVRPYALFDDNYLIQRLENSIQNSPFFSGEDFAKDDPIGFIANMIYYQNLTWQVKTLSNTIQGDFDNQRVDYDINEKVSYLMDNYLIKDNNKGNFLTPDYRDNGYEVAFINSNGNDRIMYENTPDFVESIQSASNSYEVPTSTNNEDKSTLEQELISECNIPEDGGVLIFQLSGGSIETPRIDAFACWLKKIISPDTRKNAIKITFPFTWGDNGTGFWNNLGEIFNIDDYKDIGNFYAEQLKLLDTDDINSDVIENMDLSHPGDAAKLRDILSFTIIKENKAIITADNPYDEINISSSHSELGNIDFHIINVGATKVKLMDGDNVLSNNITAGTGGFSTGKITFNPYNERSLSLQFQNPVDGLNVILVYMCLPGTQNLSNCVKASVGINVVPGEVKNIYIDLEKDLVLEGASAPFKVRGTDMFGNSVGELISQKFDTFSSSGNLTLNGVTSEIIKFSNFDKTNFSLNATGGNLDGKRIAIQVSGSINGIAGVKATEYVNVIKGRLDTYSGNSRLSSGSDIIGGLTIKLPEKDTYFINGQPNLSTLPKISLKLVDKNGNTINIDGKLSAKVKNNLVSLGNITGNADSGYKFNKTNTFYLSGGIGTIYLSPSFSAGEELLYLSMPGIDEIQLPIYIKHASPKIVSLSADKTILDAQSSTNANVKIFDNRQNIIDDENIIIKLGTANDRISLSNSGNITVSRGSYDFNIYSHDKGGLGYIYATIHTGIVPIDRQKPDTLAITIQEKMLPESGLNVMYLNLFGSDWGNQWGYMSNNEKYSESLIKNSEKLITVTTQLVDYENIKYYPVITDNKLQINNIIRNKINLTLESGLVFNISSVGKISANLNSFKLELARISEDAIEEYISTQMSNSDRGRNIIFYIPEQTDSIIQENDVINSAIYLNEEKVFDISDFTFDRNLTVLLSEDIIAGYQVWQLFLGDVLAGKLLIAVDNENLINIDLTSTSPNYGISEVWINGTSDDYGIGFYGLESSIPDNTFGYKSIQDSYDATLGIGFTSDFKNITNFGGGMPVGESTIPFASELLINIGDPLLKRINTNETAKTYDENGEIKDDTEFDLGLGEVIYSEPGKEIHKVINIDFNNDDLEDIIVIFKDGTVKILKNYGGTNPFQNLGALTILADRVSDVSVGDVDGNGYKDLIIWTASGWLRVYLNNGGIFDVDGYPVCINVNVDRGGISETPEKISGLHQIFLEDMDLDGAIDIVTNDELGFIKIFYGGTTSGNINYLSNSKYMCDENWYTRVDPNSKTVYQFGIKIDNNSHILDQSLIRWQGISDNESSEISAEDVGINSNALEDTGHMSMDNISDTLSNISSFDLSAAENIYLQNERFKQAGFGIIPVYEPGIDNEDDIKYVEIGALTGSDPVKIYKVYEDLNGNPIDGNIVDNTGSLVKGDLVRVSVYMIANKDFTGTFIDNIVGPWTIPLSEYNNQMFENFWFDSEYVDRGYITSGQINNMANHIYWNLENARYMIDNISMKRGDRLKFSYGLIYNGYSSFDIDVSILSGDNFSEVVLPSENLAVYSHDNYPDISTQPTDGCNDSMFVFFNNGAGDRRNYDKKFMDLAKLMQEYNTQSQENGNGAQNNFLNDIGNTAGNGDSQELMNQVLSFSNIMETLDWKGMLQNQGLLENISYLGDTINLGSEIINGLTNDAVKQIDNTIGGLCNGIDLSSLGLGGGGGCGLPVPFNQAFLGIGKYHVFGCYEITPLTSLIGDGWPAMTFPGNWGPTTIGYLPAPGIFGYPFKGPGDGFVDFVPQNGTYPSMFRLYLMPTLTLKLGIALCFGPYGVGKLIVDPIGSIAGNCIVFSVDLPCPNLGNSDNQGANATTEIPYEYTLLKGCNKQNNPVYLGSNESSTPFVFGGSTPNINSFQPIIPDGSYAGGLINIEIKPESSNSYQESSSIDIDAIILEGGAKIQNQIQGSQEQGLIDKIVKQWLDKQIKYIMNNLTNFKISVVWPDLAGLIGKSSEVKNVKESTDSNDDKKERCEKNKGRWIEDGASSYCEDTPASLQLKCENRGLKWNASNQTCTASDSALSSLDARGQEKLISRDQISSRSDYTNPFDQLAEAFSETPLINISTQDITVNIPMLTSEDITSYVSMSQSRVSRQSEILSKREDFFKGLISFCSNGSININGINDLGNAIEQLKEQYKDASYYSEGENDDVLGDIQGKIDALEKLEKKYNLKDLGNYDIYEEKFGGFYVHTTYTDISGIQPYEVYLYFNPGTTNLTMFTSGFDLSIDDRGSGKAKVSIKRNSSQYSNEGLQIKKSAQNISHSCASLFMDGSIDGYVNGFLNIQSSADNLIFSVKENIETLQQYKLFPLELYDWIHVVERYVGDASNLLSSTLGTFSMWMETNANRFSQYVDAIITLMTILETYQLIIDFSADWTESCSTCTNDNYDQFSCKLGKICDMLGIELPIFEIPPTKIPSIYLDFSEIHVETDVKLPNFTFNAIAVPLPELPNLPEPPTVDFSVNLDEARDAGINSSIGNTISKLIKFDLSKLSSANLGNIPLIPSPPTLPELPSFIPKIEMELPLLPPAPKIPKLPNTIQNTIKAAKIIGKILCIIKGKFGLVAESSVKAKVEQITQRDYQIPFWDNLDLTLSDWNATAAAKMPGVLGSVFTGVAALLQTNQFKEAKLKGFDLSLKTYVNLRVNFDDFYAFVESVVGKVNDISYNITDFVSSTTDFISGISKDRQDRLQACVNNPISAECNPNIAAIEEYNTLLQDVERYKSILDNLFNGLGDSLRIVETKKDDLQDLQLATDELATQLEEEERLLNTYNNQLGSTTNETDRTILLDKINYTNKSIQRLQYQINVNNEKINDLNTEISELEGKYGDSMGKYNEVKRVFGDLSERLGSLKDELTQKGNEIIEEINEEIQSAGENVDFDDIIQLDTNLSSGQQQVDNKKEKDKQRRSENLQDLYKEIDGVISYVDYDSDINENNFKILENMLSEIKDQTNNKDIKNRAQEYLSLISMNRKIEANVDSVSDVENQYKAVVNNYNKNNDEIIDLIQNDYDSFLAAVGNNDSKLVSNDSFNITLSTKLFDMDKSTINILSNQEDVMKKYMDYNMNNLQGYINALENNTPEILNMDEDEYNMSKSYLKKIKDISDNAYAIITKDNIDSDNVKLESKNKPDVLLAQSAGGSNGGGNNTSTSNNTVDIANYIDGYTLNTEEGTYLLSNRDYINKFQSRLLLTDINKDGRSDLILWDEHNIYIKYRKGYTSYDNTSYRDASNYYLYRINSYDDLLSISENGFINIGGLYIKLVDSNREVKNFKYVGQTFDTIKVSWLNSYYFGDNVDGYLVKLIHRVDQFNDKESLLHQGNNEELFDKKYILVLPKGSEFSGANVELEEGITGSVEQLIGTGNTIFGLSYYNKTDDTINLTITDIPRNWQYSEIYTLNFINNTYMLSSSSSNQVVAGPQIIADDQGPDPTIKLYRPATDTVVSEGISLEGYVGTHYILQVDWEDNVAMDRIWIANELGESLVTLENISNKTGYIEYSGLYFTETQNLSYYIGGSDINGNEYVVNANLSIKTPNIEIINILRGNQNLTYNNGTIGYSFGNNSISNPIGTSVTNSFREVPSNNTSSNNNTSSEAESVITIVAQMDQDIDSGYVQFFRNRTSDRWEKLTGKVSSYNISSFKVEPEVTEIYGGYFEIGNDIGLFSSDGDMVATINPENGKITKLRNTIDIKLDYSSQRPIVKVLEGNKTIFWIIFSSIELVSLNLISNDLSTQPLDNELFGDFYGGQAVIKNGEVILYVSPIGQIYTDATIYGDYDFDSATNSVVYSFKTSPNGSKMGEVKVKIKNLLEY